VRLRECERELGFLNCSCLVTRREKQAAQGKGYGPDGKDVKDFLDGTLERSCMGDRSRLQQLPRRVDDGICKHSEARAVLFTAVMGKSSVNAGRQGIAAAAARVYYPVEVRCGARKGRRPRGVAGRRRQQQHRWLRPPGSAPSATRRGNETNGSRSAHGQQQQQQLPLTADRSWTRGSDRDGSAA
jgi:hypothetical protein